MITFPSGHLGVHCQKSSRHFFLTNKGQRQSQLNLLEGVFPRCIYSNQLKATKVQESMIVAILRLQGAAQGINVKMAV